MTSGQTAYVLKRTCLADNKRQYLWCWCACLKNNKL